MTPEENIKRWLELIKQSAGDFERAHSLEDDLYHQTIQFVADGGVLTPEMAKLVLTSADIDFPRYCA